MLNFSGFTTISLHNKTSKTRLLYAESACLKLIISYRTTAHGWNGEGEKGNLAKICRKCRTIMKLGTLIPYL